MQRILEWTFLFTSLLCYDLSFLQHLLSILFQKWNSTYRFEVPCNPTLMSFISLFPQKCHSQAHFYFYSKYCSFSCFDDTMWILWWLIFSLTSCIWDLSMLLHVIYFIAYSFIWIYRNSFIHSPVDGHLSCCRLSVTTHGAVMNVF